MENFVSVIECALFQIERSFALALSLALLLEGVAALETWFRNRRQSNITSSTLPKKTNQFTARQMIVSEANDSICQRDTIKGGAGERGRIDIERDTAGRPVVILWNVNTDFSAEASMETLKKGVFDLRGSSNNTEASGSVDSVTKEKEEVTQEVDVSAPVGLVVLWCVCGVLLLICLRLELSKLWRKKQEK